MDNGDVAENLIKDGYHCGINSPITNGNSPITLLFFDCSYLEPE